MDFKYLHFNSYEKKALKCKTLHLLPFSLLLSELSWVDLCGTRVVWKFNTYSLNFSSTCGMEGTWIFPYEFLCVQCALCTYYSVLNILLWRSKVREIEFWKHSKYFLPLWNLKWWFLPNVYVKYMYEYYVVYVIRNIFSI